MITVLNRKGKVMMITSSLEKAYNGLQAGTYKVGEYSVIEENGKVHRFVKYICQRKY